MKTDGYQGSHRYAARLLAGVVALLFAGIGNAAQLDMAAHGKSGAPPPPPPGANGGSVGMGTHSGDGTIVKTTTKADRKILKTEAKPTSSDDNLKIKRPDAAIKRATKARSGAGGVNGGGGV